MHNILYTFLCLCVVNITCAQVNDDFTDGDFTANPAWQGETVEFEIDASDQLHLNAPSVTSESYLSTPSNAIENATWEFYVSFDFNPSSSNLAQVYLVSDQANLENPLNGYFVLIGDSDDEVSLYRQDGTSNSKIIDGIDATVDSNPVNVRVQVTRDVNGNWELLIDPTGGSSFTSQGTVFDDTYIQTSHFGVFCDYTSTRSDKFFYDDFSVTGMPYTDTDPPTASSLLTPNTTTIQVGFNEAMDAPTTTATTNYTINQGIGAPGMVNDINPDTMELQLNNPLSNGTAYDLTIENVEDQSGNSISDTTITFTFIQPGIPGSSDLIINEIYADPSPSFGLPDEEFVEIYNRSNQYFFTENWTFDDGGSPNVFPQDTIAPGSYTIVGPTGIRDSFPGLNTIEVSGFPGLNNGGDPLTLADENGNVLDFVSYSADWYDDNDKDDGGYTLELINPDHPCSGENNWRASNAAIGGTPGTENSIFDTTPDSEAPFIDQTKVLSEDSVVVTLNEKIDSSVIINAAYSIAPSIIIENYYISEAQTSTYSFVVQTPLDSGVIYEYTIQQLEDCWQNAGNTIAEIILPQRAGKNDIIINEVLFNPVSGSEDYVEIYNNSDKIISLKNWMLANYDDSINNYEAIVEQEVLFYPETYWALTEDSLDIKDEFPFTAHGRLIQVENVPTYSNDSGTVYLSRADTTLIDYFSYSEEMHLDLLGDEDGKSLERISFDAPANEETNWHTAAEKEGFGTPGYENSQLQNAAQTGQITLSPEIFSPDNDGIDDNLLINYKMDASGYVANIDIYDASGRLVKNLKNNEFLGREGTFTWDGFTNNEEKARSGHYIILFSWFDPKGKTQRQKATCVLAHKR